MFDIESDFPGLLEPMMKGHVFFFLRIIRHCIQWLNLQQDSLPAVECLSEGFLQSTTPFLLPPYSCVKREMLDLFTGNV